MKYDLTVFQEPRGVMRIFQLVSIKQPQRCIHLKNEQELNY